MEITDDRTEALEDTVPDIAVEHDHHDVAQFPGLCSLCHAELFAPVDDISEALAYDEVPDTDVIRDIDGSILRGPSLPCGCPLDADCDGYHALRDAYLPGAEPPF